MLVATPAREARMRTKPSIILNTLRQVRSQTPILHCGGSLGEGRNVENSTPTQNRFDCEGRGETRETKHWTGLLATCHPHQ